METRFPRNRRLLLLSVGVFVHVFLHSVSANKSWQSAFILTPIVSRGCVFYRPFQLTPIGGGHSNKEGA